MGRLLPPVSVKAHLVQSDPQIVTSLLLQQSQPIKDFSHICTIWHHIHGCCLYSRTEIYGRHAHQGQESPRSAHSRVCSSVIMRLSTQLEGACKQETLRLNKPSWTRQGATLYSEEFLVLTFHAHGQKGPCTPEQRMEASGDTSNLQVLPFFLCVAS